MSELKLKVNVVEAKNRDSLLSALIGSVDDNDLNGENGEEYLWESAKNAGFDNNLDFIADVVKNVESDKKCIEEFFKLCYGADSYYEDYEVDTVCNENGDVIAFGIAYVTDC